MAFRLTRPYLFILKYFLNCKLVLLLLLLLLLLLVTLFNKGHSVQDFRMRMREVRM